MNTLRTRFNFSLCQWKSPLMDPKTHQEEDKLYESYSPCTWKPVCEVFFQIFTPKWKQLIIKYAIDKNRACVVDQLINMYTCAVTSVNQDARQYGGWSLRKYLNWTALRERSRRNWKRWTRKIRSVSIQLYYVKIWSRLVELNLIKLVFRNSLSICLRWVVWLLKLHICVSSFIWCGIWMINVSCCSKELD